MNVQELRTLYLQNCIADAIEALLAVLDALDPDPDLEPDLGSGDDREGDYPHPNGGTADWEPNLGAPNTGSQQNWASGSSQWDECEDVNEDGVEGDPHGHTDHGIADRDALDSEEFCLGGLGFDGSGQKIAKRMLAR